MIVLPHRRKAFRSGGGGSTLLTDLLSYWDLDDDGVWSDDPGTWDLSEGGTVTVNATGGPDGGPCAEKSGQGNYLDRASTSWPGGNNYSLSFWVYYTATGDKWLLEWRSGGDTPFHSQIAVSGGNLYLYVNSTTGFTVTAPAINTWHHIVMTYDGTSFKGYINGSLQNTVTATFNLPTTPMSLRLGQDTFGGGYGAWTGRFSKMGIWDKKLEDSEITTLYNSGAGLNYADL
jgi:hypothetical protein